MPRSPPRTAHTPPGVDLQGRGQFTVFDGEIPREDAEATDVLDGGEEGVKIFVDPALDLGYHQGVEFSRPPHRLERHTVRRAELDRSADLGV